MEFNFVSHSGQEVVVEAKDEKTARRLAMIHFHGKRADDIIPHAPDYDGRGLMGGRVWKNWLSRSRISLGTRSSGGLHERSQKDSSSLQ